MALQQNPLQDLKAELFFFGGAGYQHATKLTLENGCSKMIIGLDFYLWDRTLGHVGKPMENDCWPLKVHNSQRFSNPPPQTTREPVVDVSCCPLVIKHRW